MTRKQRHISRLAALLLSAPVAVLALPPELAFAWRIVYDPTNYAQNVLQAARALEQINQQIAQLQNEAQMLINDARNLASLPQSSLEALQQSVQDTQALLGDAQRIAYDVQAIDEAFATDYGAASTTVSDQALIDGAQERWKTTVASLQDTMRVQAGVVGNIETGRAEMEELVGASQNATGALQATQAGNQILALQSQQITDLTALLAAQGRAESLATAAETAAQEQAREQRRRFLAPGDGYQPGNATMFRP
jgi:type IV secretion system protein TrbJ